MVPRLLGWSADDIGNKAHNYLDSLQTPHPPPNNNNMSDPISLYGLTPLPADQSKLQPATTTPQPVPITSLQPPTTPLALRVDEYCVHHLDQDTYRHSRRVYAYGVAIALQCFPEWNIRAEGGKLDETWFACAMLHDAGTTPQVMQSTRLSYEFWAGIFALDFLQSGAGGASKDQAESVAEAIIRHQDIQPVGNVTLLTTLVHLATLLDNIGAGEQYIHPQTIKGIVDAYPRKGWSGCFKRTVEREKQQKPWTMGSRIEGFEDKIEENGSRGGVTGKYD
ncbi:hypothetical protein QFC22_002489 [Naganishia vaughanmartiniae]|uniref:Uncharacterized protein n=1 Tax=Naganishia vaughanmartiniae TaxID=1424756 RepID=A0ACC2XDX4_9TREE|nr:hypothetical protein QFC22_002489 [Naganishia vaughanmartiniae]